MPAEHDASDEGQPTSSSTSKRGTSTSSFGVGRREGHDASAFYERFSAPVLTDDETINVNPELRESTCFEGSSVDMHQLADNSVALVVTSPPYFVGKEYELAVAAGDDDGSIPATYLDFLAMLREVFRECVRVLEPGGRIAVNVANLGRKPYRSLSADVIGILQDDLGLLLRGEVIWMKSRASSGSCAWGSFAKASNPVLRDNTERVIIASKGRFSRALSPSRREAAGLPHASTLSNDEFLDVTKDVWELEPASARRVGHPAPFPIDLPRRLIELYTYVGDTVLDPFCGAGTALIAAERTGRVGVGYDTDPAYVELTMQRLGADEPMERDQAHAAAVEQGRKITDLVAEALTTAGFAITKTKPSLRGLGISYDFTVEDVEGRQWWIDVAGGFTVARSGLERSDGLWHVLGRLRTLEAMHPHLRVLVLTPHPISPTSTIGKTLRAAPPGVLHDVISISDDGDLHRLAAYGAGERQPLPGFWKASDLTSQRQLPLVTDD
jgi:site-specific DNA-methyltransferase (adenine-specific)